MRLVLLATLSLLCCGGERESLWTARLGISNADGPSALDALGMVDDYCSATLVGYRTVLTAAHCLVDWSDAKQHIVRFGETSYAVQRAVSHPSFLPNHLDDQGQRIIQDHDLAIIQLETYPAPRPIALSTLEPRVGSKVKMVGYGVTGHGREDFGEQREGRQQITKLEQATISMQADDSRSAVACGGDSGGAVLHADQLVGVIRSTDTGCRSVTEAGRVDIDLAWIRTASLDDLVIDGVAPALPLFRAAFAEAQRLVLPGDVPLALEASPEHWITSARVIVDFHEVFRGQRPPASVFLEPGQHRLEVLVGDRNGREAWARQTVTVAQGHSPEVLITSPLGESRVTASTVIEAQVVGPRPIVRVDALVDGLRVGSKIEAPYQFAVGLGPGVHQLSVRALDDQGRSGYQTIRVLGGDALPDGVPYGGCALSGPAMAGGGSHLLVLLALILLRRYRPLS